MLFVASNLIFSGRSHVGSPLLMRSEKRLFMTSQTPAPYANKFIAMKSFWLFLWAKQYREKFLKLSQPKELRERSKDLSEVAWQPEEWITAKENRQVLVEAGWFGMWRPFRAWQFRSDQRRICEWSLIFKLETVKLLCLQQFFSSDTDVERTPVISTRDVRPSLLATVSDSLCFLTLSENPAATLLPFTLAPSCRTLNQNIFYIRSDYLVLCIKTHTKWRHSLPPSSRLSNLDSEQTWP